MKSYNLYFFRHGITKGNLNAQYIGHTDLPLTTDSINELHSIKAKYHYPKVDAVFSSPLKRCKDSAEIMFPVLIQPSITFSNAAQIRCANSALLSPYGVFA